MRRPVRATPALISVVLVIALALAGCSGAASPAGPSISVSDAWARPSTQMGGAIAIYMTLTNSGSADDTLTKASTPVGDATLHETMAGDSGMMGMQPVDGIPVAKGGTTKLEPGGYHVMVENLKQMVEPGSTIDVTLTFKSGASQTIKAQVRAN